MLWFLFVIGKNPVKFPVRYKNENFAIKKSFFAIKMIFSLLNLDYRYKIVDFAIKIDDQMKRAGFYQEVFRFNQLCWQSDPISL